LGHSKKFLPIVFASVLSLALISIIIDDVYGQVPPNPIPSPILGDFKCYFGFPNNPLTSTTTVKLSDQFQDNLQEELTVMRRFCANVEKSPGPDYPGSADEMIPNQHFDVYPLDTFPNTPDPLDIVVDLQDQFGLTRHAVQFATELWVPAAKQQLECPPNFSLQFLIPPSHWTCEGDQTVPTVPCPPISGYAVNSASKCEGPPLLGTLTPNLNTDDIHYLCYGLNPIIPYSKSNPVTLTDQFGTTPVNLASSVRLCNPVIKEVVSGPFGAQSPTGTKDADHLKCYGFTGDEQMLFQYSVSDQLIGNNAIGIVFITGNTFCTPAIKTIVPNPVIGGTLIPIDATAMLLVGSQTTASWMIPVIVAGIGFAIVILRKL